MSSEFLVVNPIIIYPVCMLNGIPQNCFSCAIYKNKGCISPRGLCVREYKNHKKGCPNYGKKRGCPPNVPMFDEVFDLNKDIYLISIKYDLGRHIKLMQKKHPLWTETQLKNVLYWQGTAKKQLRERIKEFIKNYREEGYYVTTTPEAMGVDVTRTLKLVGIDLEWPAKETVYKIALAGIPQDKEYYDILL